MKRAVVFVISLLTLLALTWTALAQTGDGYDLSWSTVDGGGRESSGGNYTLMSAAGQPDAGVLSGGDYTLQGGFQRCAVAHDPDDNGLVDVADIQFVATRWRSASPGPADRDGDGQVTVVDVMLVAAGWGRGC